MSDDFIKISLGGGLFSLIDAEDYDKVKNNLWHLNRSNYASATINKKTVLMHRLIINPPKGMVVDHIDGHRLDNRKKNLRVCTPKENIQNQLKHVRFTSSKYKGVSWEKKNRTWLARIRHQNVLYGLGYYNTEAEAAFVYNVFSELLRPTFGKLNIIDVEIKCEKIISETIIKKMCRLTSIQEESLIRYYSGKHKNKFA